MRTQLSTTSENNQRFTKNNSFQMGKTKSAAPVEKNSTKPDFVSSQVNSNQTASNSNFNSLKSSTHGTGA